MKKIVIFTVLIMLLVSLAPTAYAAGYGSVSGPSTVRAGDTVTVSYSIGGGVFGANGSVSYDPSQLTLQGYHPSAPGGWLGSFSGDTFLFYDDTLQNAVNSATIFTATFKVNANLAPGTKITVSVSSTVSDGQQDTGAGGSWSATIAPPLSKNCDLASLTVTGASISPAFNAGTTGYSSSVPFSTSSVQVSAKAADEKAKVAVSNPSLVAGGTTAITVTVTAESGAVKTYTIRIAREQDPNYVPSSNNKLAGLTVEGQPLSPAFSPDTTRYYIWLPYETETVSITGNAADSKASVSIGEAPKLEPGKAVDIAVTVTAEDKTQQVYTVTVFRAPVHGETDRFLQGERAQEPEPEPSEPAVTEPVVSAPADTDDTQQTGKSSWILPAVIALVVGLAIGFAATMLIFKRSKGIYE